MGVRFDVDAQYSLLDVVGQGAYGVVCAALDEDSGETVAIKKITNAFEHELYAKRTLREIRLLRLLKHDNLIGLKIILPPLKSDGFKDLYIISELMERLRLLFCAVVGLDGATSSCTAVLSKQMALGIVVAADGRREVLSSTTSSTCMSSPPSGISTGV